MSVGRRVGRGSRDRPACMHSSCPVAWSWYSMPWWFLIPNIWVYLVVIPAYHRTNSLQNYSYSIRNQTHSILDSVAIYQWGRHGNSTYLHWVIMTSHNINGPDVNVPGDHLWQHKWPGGPFMLSYYLVRPDHLCTRTKYLVTDHACLKFDFNVWLYEISFSGGNSSEEVWQ